MASFNRQLLNGVQYDFLALSSNISAGVDMDGYASVAFLVNFAGASGRMTVAFSVEGGNHPSRSFSRLPSGLRPPPTIMSR